MYADLAAEGAEAEGGVDERAGALEACAGGADTLAAVAGRRGARVEEDDPVRVYDVGLNQRDVRHFLRLRHPDHVGVRRPPDLQCIVSLA